MVFWENYLSISLSLDCGGFSNVLVATSLAISKQSTFPHSLQAQNMYLNSISTTEKLGFKVQFQISLFCGLTEMHCWFGTGQASQPHFQKGKGHTLSNNVDISTLAKKAHTQNLTTKLLSRPLLQLLRLYQTGRLQKVLLNDPISDIPSLHLSRDSLHCSTNTPWFRNFLLGPWFRLDKALSVYSSKPRHQTLPSQPIQKKPTSAFQILY